MELTFCPLFSGSSGNALYVGCDKTKLLIDAGMSGAKIASELSRIGVHPSELDALLITHEHADHIAGVGVMSRKYGLPVYANEDTWAAMERKVGAIAPENRCYFTTGEDFYLGDFSILPFGTSHDAADPVGFALEAGRMRVAIATDLGSLKESWLSHLRGCDLVLLESNHDVAMLQAGGYPYELKRRILGPHGHLSNDDAGLAAVDLAKSGTRCLVLGHLSGENNTPDLALQSVTSTLESSGVRLDTLRLSVASREGHNPVWQLSDEGFISEEAVR